MLRERVVTPLRDEVAVLLDGELLDLISVIVLSELLEDAREPMADAVGLATRLTIIFI